MWLSMMIVLLRVNPFFWPFIEKICMRYPAEETAVKHQRILQVASVLFRERGFHSVSVNDVMKASGMTKGAFYHHFESKEHLIAECLRDASSKALARMATAEHSSEAMAEHIQDYVSDWHRDERGDGCLIAALGSEAAREEYVRPLFTQHVEGVLTSLMAPKAGAEDPSNRRNAIRTLSEMVGAIVLARAVDELVLSEEILREVRSSFE
jgi:TetR/AcrR family transcriptional repressor of nem operon